MPIRTFTDDSGTTWRVWSTIPDADSPLAVYYPGGWLTFDCDGSTLRRLSPAPVGWEAARDDRLELMCQVAVEVPRHTGERLKMERPVRLDELQRPPATADGAPPPRGSAPDGDEKLGI